MNLKVAEVEIQGYVAKRLLEPIPVRIRVSNFTINENTFLISDSHFGHKAVLQREPSRLKSARANGYDDFYAFHKDLWNKAVGKKDRILHLGDLYYPVGFMTERTVGKQLLVGNNDVMCFTKLKTLKSWQVQRGLNLQIPNAKAIRKKLYEKYIR